MLGSSCVIDDSIGSTSMNETFRLRRYYRDVGIVGLLFFTAMLVLSIYVGMKDVLPALRIWFLYDDRRVGRNGSLAPVVSAGLLAGEDNCVTRSSHCSRRVPHQGSRSLRSDRCALETTPLWRKHCFQNTYRQENDRFR